MYNDLELARKNIRAGQSLIANLKNKFGSSIEGYVVCFFIGRMGECETTFSALTPTPVVG